MNAAKWRRISIRKLFYDSLDNKEHKLYFVY